MSGGTDRCPSCCARARRMGCCGSSAIGRAGCARLRAPRGRRTSHMAGRALKAWRQFRPSRSTKPPKSRTPPLHITPDEPPVTIGALPAGGTDSRDEAEADDQLAMFGAISPMDPEPKVRKARRPASETSKAKRTPARRAPRTTKVKSDAPRTRRRAGGRGRNEEAE